MHKFMKGDKVIIKSTIGTTNEVLEVTYVFDVCVAIFTTEEAVILSDEKGYWAKDLELWNPKKDFSGEYKMKKVELGKKYKTRDGFDVEIIAIRPELKDGVIGIMKGEDFVREWATDGTYSHDKEPCDFDLIEVPPYANLKVDDKVIVWDDNVGIKYRGYFAGVNEQDDPLVWDNGTSWSNSANLNYTTVYDNCVKWEDKDD